MMVGMMMMMMMVVMMMMTSHLLLSPLHTLSKATDAFGKPYLAYNFLIRHANLEWRLTKRFSAFAALHEQLRSVRGDDDPQRLAGASLPALPPRWPKPSSEEGIEERRLKLESYLTALVTLPRAMENPHVLGFLGIMNPRTDLPLDDPLRPGRKRQVGSARPTPRQGCVCVSVCVCLLH
jgi:hypothetical protein